MVDTATAATMVKSVILATSWTPLLSGLLHECHNSTDTTCSGGIAAFRATLRHKQQRQSAVAFDGIEYDEMNAAAASATAGAEDESTNPDIIPAVHFPLLDRNNAFVHMHPLGLSVNRLILNELMELDVFASSPSVLLQNKVDYDVSNKDLGYLQSEGMMLLLTNVGVPPQNSWHPYTKSVHFDASTGLAVLSISKSEEELNVPQVESAVGTLRYVHKVNEENGCYDVSSYTSVSVGQEEDGGQDIVVPWEGIGTILEDSTSPSIHDSQPSSTTPPSEQSTPPSSKTTPQQQCWLPIIYHSDDGNHNFVDFILGMANLPTSLRPAMIIDTSGNFEEYHAPQFRNGMWIASHDWNSRDYFQHLLNVTYDEYTMDNGSDNGSGGGVRLVKPRLTGVEFTTESLSELPEEVKDDTYRSEILALRKVADEALENNPVVGYTGDMPVVRHSLIDYRPCKSGECPIGNLYTDAARWYAKADVAFITSGGVRGPGWSAGQVKVSDIWNALPFPNNLCTGYMNGVHLFQLLNYSMSVSTFEGADTDDGGRLLQVSGMKVKYNTRLSPSRIISIDILDRTFNEYKPIERLQIYKFATDSYLCGAYKPYPSLISDTLVVEGEQPGKIDAGVLFQEMLASYLNATTTSQALYDSETQGRLVNDTTTTGVLNLIETEESCSPGEFFQTDVQTCQSCPIEYDVTFTKQAIEFEVLSSQQDSQGDTITLKNHERFSVAVIPKRLPEWLSFVNNKLETEATTSLAAGEALHLSMEVDSSRLDKGTTHLTIAMGVLDGGAYPGCRGQDATFDITLRVYPAEQSNYLGSISAVGFTLFAIIATTSITFAIFVFCNRGQKIVRALQPIFLVTICFGVLMMGSSIIPLSIDDETASQLGCDIKCMALPWLLCLGFSIAISALIAKLWRINRLFNASRSMRRIQVRVKDVATPLAILSFINVVVLLTWTLVAPLVWQRFEVVEGEAWNTYGACVGSSESSTTAAFLAVLGILNASALVLALVQAWRARNISDEYSETKSVGFAVYSWFQLLLVGVPVLFLIDKHNTKPRYFILVALIFLVCMSMLLIIFVPLLMQIRRAKLQQKIRVDRTTTNLGSKSSNTSRVASRDTRNSMGSVRISGLNVNFDQEERLGSGKEIEREPSDGTIWSVAIPAIVDNPTESSSSGLHSCV